MSPDKVFSITVDGPPAIGEYDHHEDAQDGWVIKMPGYDLGLEWRTYSWEGSPPLKKILSVEDSRTVSRRLLVTKDVLDIFTEFQLGNTHYYSAAIQRKDEVIEDYYLLDCHNAVSEKDVDYRLSSFT